MSVTHTAWVWEHSDSTGNDRLVLLCLADMIGHHQGDERGGLPEGWYCFPKQEFIAGRTHVSVRTVQRAINDLEESGELQVTRRRAESRPSLYAMFQADPPDKLAGALPTNWRDPPDTGVVTLPTTVADQGTVSESLEEPSIAQSGADRASVPFEADFDEVWDLYPRKVGRQKALRAYRARRRAGVQHEDLLDASRSYARARDGEDERYTMHGSTFFGPDEPWKEQTDGKPLTDIGIEWSGCVGCGGRRRMDEVVCTQCGFDHAEETS